MNKSISRILVSGLTVQAVFMSGAFGIEPADTVLDIPMELPMDSVELFAINALSADINTNARPEKLYKTPEASAFQEYGKFSTEGADGSVNISIPIHTISCRDLQIPITLHYGGKGIKVAEEASWVGLGWDLSIGGCINYIPAGQYDFLVRNAQWNDYLKALDLKQDDAFQFVANKSDHTVMEDLANGMGERDFYSVNLLGRAFLFYINPYDGKPTVIGADDGDYSITPFNADGWMIKDAMGFSYEFSTLEYNLYDGAGMLRSAWYLSDIETPEGVTASFRYEFSYVKGLPQYYQWYYAQHRIANGVIIDFHEKDYSGYLPSLQNEFGSGFSYGNTEVMKPWLKSISTSNQTVTFETCDRTDMSGARRLERIKVLDVNGNTVFNHHFNYGTFSHSTTGGSCLSANSPLITDPSNTERLKLTSLSHMSLNGTDSLSYAFTYNEKYPLPMKTSAAIDFWGYYNGKENFTANPDISCPRSLIPSLGDCTIKYSPSIAPLSSSLSVKGACRFSDSEKILSGTLASITYPTGGKSVFTFEPHRFKSSPAYPLCNTGYSDFLSSVEDLNYPSTPTSPGPIVNRQVNITNPVKGFLTVIFEARAGKKLRDLKLAGADVTLQPMASPKYKKIHVSLDSCGSADMESSYYKGIIPVDLEAVPYMFIANLPARIPYGEGWVKATLEYRETDPELTSGGAGLRIRAIDNYDDDDNLTGRREFEYSLPDGTTAGKMPVTERATECRTKYIVKVIERTKFGEVDQLALSELSTIKINSSLGGGSAFTKALSHGPVGYTRVTERELDGKGDIMKSTISEFRINCALEPYEDMHLLFSSGGGELMRRTVLGAAADTLQTEDFSYSDLQRRMIKCNMSIEDQYLEYDSPSEDLLTEEVLKNIRTPRYLVSVYPYVAFWRVLSEITIREYTQTGSLESKKTFAYNDSNRLVSEENIVSGNKGLRTAYKYSVDYPSTLPYSRMVQSPFYVRGIPVETTFYEHEGGTLTEARKKKLIYTFNGNKADMLHLYRIEESTAGGPLMTRETFSYSDNGGTLVGTVMNATDKKAYLWSYGHTCPVAVIDGASYDEVEGWVGSSFVKSLSSAKIGIDTLLSQLRSKLKDKDVMVTTYTFKPLVGITSQTSPSGEKITYEYDGFNRLSRILDHNGKVIETYSYTYR